MERIARATTVRVWVGMTLVITQAYCKQCRASRQADAWSDYYSHYYASYYSSYYAAAYGQKGAISDYLSKMVLKRKHGVRAQA